MKTPAITVIALSVCASSIAFAQQARQLDPVARAKASVAAQDCGSDVFRLRNQKQCADEAKIKGDNTPGATPATKISNPTTSPDYGTPKDRKTGKA
jgi:hypothetical protein